MENSYIKQELSKFQIDSQISFENALREVLQKLILVGLAKVDFFSKAAFYGGTCLRIFHNLDRFSEDLDFNVIDKKYSNINFKTYFNKSLNYINSFGLNAIIKDKEKNIETSVISSQISLDLNYMKELFGFDNFSNFPNGQTLSVKVEVETNYIEGANYENKIILNPTYSLIKCFDISSLFAGKINALINRKWNSRIKGRDYFDFYFYIANEIKPNYEYIINFSQKVLQNKEDIINSLISKFNSVDFNNIKQDVRSFINPNKDLSFMDKEVYLNILTLIK